RKARARARRRDRDQLLGRELPAGLSENDTRGSVMGKPLNMNPEDYAAQIIREQQQRIAELEAGGSGGNPIAEFSFSANTAEPPGTGQLRFNATPSFTTKIWPHKMTSLNVDSTNFLMSFHNGDQVFIQDKNEANAYAKYVLDAEPIVKSGYIEMH